MNGTYNFDEIMRPFWCSDTMYNESVLMLSENGKPACAHLLFKKPVKLSVRNSYLDTEYIEGEDWIYEDGLIKLTDKSKATFMTLEELYPAQPREGWTFPKAGGGNILFQEKHFFHDKQLSVTYMHPEDKWEGTVPEYAGDKLCKTLSSWKRSSR